MRVGVIALALIAFVTPAAGEDVSVCLQYEPHEVQLYGRLDYQTFPGRPNYQSLAGGDEPETYWILHLSEAICVASATELNTLETGVVAVQLVPDASQPAWNQDFKGKRVKVHGSLWHGHSGHHKTKILLSVKTLALLVNSPPNKALHLTALCL